MLTELEEERTDFADTLKHNLCVRILQRRSVASQLARLVVFREETTDLDKFLEAAEDIEAVGGLEGLIKSFLDSGDVPREINKFTKIQRNAEIIYLAILH